MMEHSGELDWAASWFRWLSRATVVATVLGAIGQVFNATRPTALNATFNTATMQALAIMNFVTVIIGGLVTYFLLRTGFIICSFLADFARGLLSQQIKRERQNQQPHH